MIKEIYTQIVIYCCYRLLYIATTVWWSKDFQNGFRSWI